MKYTEQIEQHLLSLALRESNITGSRNKHMTHIEDLIILGGAEGIEHALDTFNSLYLEFKGETPKSQRRVSVKIDGAPAVFVWSSFPGLRGPGLSMKGLFAKTPKAAYTAEEVIEVFGKDNQGNIRQDLVNKLTAMLRYIPQLGIPEGEIWQGDFLYDRESVHLQNIDDEPYYTFHPNTIVYAVPVHSDNGARMEESEVGVVWHTVYTGDSVENASSSFTAKAENLNNVPQVFSTDPYIKSIAGTVTMTAEESEAVDHKLTVAEEMAQQLIGMPNYETVVANEDFIQSFFTVFQNSTIRSGKKVPNPETFIADFTEWAITKVSKQAEKKIAGLKTERGKLAAEQKLQQALTTIQETIDESEDVLVLIVELIGVFTDIKEVFTHKMDALGNFQAYLQMKSGEIRQTGQEGFAVSDIVGNVVKFIDRTEFSYANFSSDIAKGWENTRVIESAGYYEAYDKILNSLHERMESPSVTSLDINKFLQELFVKLEQAAGTLTPQQLTTLKHEVYTLIGEDLDIMKDLETFLALFPSHRKELSSPLYLAFRSVDDKALKVFLASLKESPVITPDIVLQGRTQRIDWMPYLQQRLSSIMNEQDGAAIADAMYKSFMVYKGGSAGMGKGELQYAILCGGSKPEKGDLAIPGFGELELKGDTGRLRGLSAPIGSPASAYKKVVARYMQEPELQELADVMKNANNLTLKKKPSDPFYSQVRQILPEERYRPLFIETTKIYMETLYRTAINKGYSLDQDLIVKTGNAIADGDYLRGISYQAAIQYAVYKQADGFRGIMSLDERGFVYIENPEDIVTAVDNNILTVSPASMKDTIAAAAGITIKKTR